MTQITFEAGRQAEAGSVSGGFVSFPRRMCYQCLFNQHLARASTATCVRGGTAQLACLCSNHSLAGGAAAVLPGETSVHRQGGRLGLGAAAGTHSRNLKSSKPFAKRSIFLFTGTGKERHSQALKERGSKKESQTVWQQGPQPAQRDSDTVQLEFLWLKGHAISSAKGRVEKV
jgi:hypothetical protein